jgi:threonine/homoserine/homoserine lactone efflux protein
MATVISDLLPLAFAVAISPLPLIAVVLILLSKQASKTCVGFLIGWTAGIVVVTSIAVVLVGQTERSSAALTTLSSVLEIIVGVLLLAIGVAQWRLRPKRVDDPKLPRWLSSIDSLTGSKALVVGVLLTAINPKNLLICFTAATTIGAGDLSAAGKTVAVTVFTLLAISPVAVLIAVYLSARQRMNDLLMKLRRQLIQNTATVITVLIVIIGAVLIGKGVRDFPS